MCKIEILYKKCLDLTNRYLIISKLFDSWFMIKNILIASSYTVVQETSKCKNVIVNEQMAATLYIAFFVRWYLRK